MNEEILNEEMTEMTVDEGMKANLISAANWAKFLCIVGSISAGLILLVGIILLFVGSNYVPYASAAGFAYIILGAIYIYPILKGFQFANSTKSACLYNEKEDLAQGFEGLQSLFQFIGILTIIILALYALIFIAAIALI
jgi:hypothetical protein